MAFAILSVALAALLRAFSSGLSAVGAADAYRTAVLLARSKVDEIGPLIPLAEGHHVGTFEHGFDWRADILAHELAEAAVPQVAAYRIVVTVSWQGGRSVTLTSLRLAAAE